MGTGQRAVLLKETIERLVGLMSSQSISGVAAMRGDRFSSNGSTLGTHGACTT